LLKDSWRFDDLVGDFRYGLKGGVEFSPERIASSLRALKSLEYQDNKIVKEAVLKVHNKGLRDSRKFFCLNCLLQEYL